MKFDNSPTVIKIQMHKRLLAVLIAVLVALLYTTNLWSYVQNLTGITRVAFTVFLAFIFFLFYLYHFFTASSFIFFSDDEPKIILRFYQLNMFNKSKNSYEIPKSEFMGYRIESKFFKLKQDLVVFRKSQGNIVRYPPLSISSLTQEEKNKLIKTLNLYAKQ